MKRSKRDREDNEVERLQQEVRDLKSVNRSLMKRLKKIDREYAQQIEEINKQRAEEEDTRRHDEDRSKRRCSKCGEGEIEVINTVPGRTWEQCTHCTYRSKAHKTNN